MKKNAQPEPGFSQLLREKLPGKRLGKNCLSAFLSGGLLCAGAEFFEILLAAYSGLNEESRSSLVLLCVIGLVALFTGLGWYDKLGQQLGAGLAVPISGFANSVAAAMLEHRSEGLVLGCGCNSFKLAGAVIVFGISSAFFVSLLSLLFPAL
ncbi:MAG: SpoVA/SpoVAEb family sporulation membrane protein [Bacillota bacterium]|nr:SpoVA/SpoVAEb family sporulation membrane protein [Bacillota bacterium]